MTSREWWMIAMMIACLAFQIISSRKNDKECEERWRDLEEYKNCLGSGDEDRAEILREQRKKDPYFIRHADEMLKWRNFFRNQDG